MLDNVTMSASVAAPRLNRYGRPGVLKSASGRGRARPARRMFYMYDLAVLMDLIPSCSVGG